MKAGAVDFVTKPLVLGEIKLLIERLQDQGRLAHTVDYYTQRDAQGSGLDNIVGESAPMRELTAAIAQVLDAEARLSDAAPPAVLIVGETGTGKELVARALHFGGPRRARPFVELNCGALPSQLVEAELFGYERGAFTDARQRKAGLLATAEGGSVFLDEIGETELATQVKLLKFLEEKQVRRLGGLHATPVDVRVLSATNQPLQQLVQQGRFRADLYYRLRIVELQVPPLRERGDDIVLLARHFLATHAGRYRKAGLRFSDEVERQMLAYPWPGNVRELRNAVEQAVLMAVDTTICWKQMRFLANDVPPSPAGPPPSAYAAATPAATAPAAAAQPAGEDLNLERMERYLVRPAMARTGQNVSAAARLLGVSRDTLRYRLERLADGAPPEP
jgi:DNA-binding NtrC family response regulator